VKILVKNFIIDHIFPAEHCFDLIDTHLFLRTKHGHSEVFEKMTDKSPSLLALGDKIVLIIAFEKRFLIELPPRSSWLSQ
jgi:hypothetical protein